MKMCGPLMLPEQALSLSVWAVQSKSCGWQRIEVGFMSGVSNIVYWLKEHGIEPEKKLVDEIFTAAKQHNKILTDDEIWNIVKYVRYESGEPATDTLDEWKEQIKGQ